MKKAPSPEQIEAAREKRAHLRALSKRIQNARKAGVFPFTQHATTNEGLVFIYSEQVGQTDWASFMGWKERGYSVKKGEKGFAIWGEPMRARGAEKPAAQDAGETAEDSFSWFPVAHLFHAGQVQDADGNAPASFAPAARPTAYEVPETATPAPAFVPASMPLLLMAPADVACETAA